MYTEKNISNILHFLYLRQTVGHSARTICYVSYNTNMMPYQMYLIK